MRGVGLRGVLAAAAAAGLAAGAVAPSQAFTVSGHARRGALPKVLRLVDRSRTIELPGGRRVARPLTTYLFYPPAAGRDRPLPLVVFGHGYASTPWTYRRLLRAWAAHGYVVAAPVFPLGNANAPGGPNERDIVNQPRDLRFVISRVLAASASVDSPLHGLVDPAKVAVAGQSDGAMTAFAAAYERPWRDRRIRAAVVLSGAVLGPSRYVDPDEVPLLAVQGTADRINPPVYSLDLFRRAGRPKFLLLLRGAGHLPPYTHPGARLAEVERVSTAFLDHYLDGTPLRRIRRAAARLRTASLTSEP